MSPVAPLASGLDEQKLARAALAYLAEPGDPVLGALLGIYEPAEVMAAIKADMLPAIGPGCGDNRASRAALQHALGRWRARLPGLPGDQDVIAACGDGVRLIGPDDAEWPASLDRLGPARPYALWLRGRADLGSACLRSVSVVGSRAATGYGAHVAGEIAADLGERGWTVVSGGAYGIDAAAHRGALATGGVTIAVLACGVDHPYPAGHAELFSAIAADGLVISEWPPGRRPARLRFLIRNRVIAALSGGTVIVEAGERSGALNTARHAANLGKPLMAVPGPVTSAQSAGCHLLMREWGATCVTEASDIIEMLTPMSAPAAPAPAAPAPSAPADRVPAPAVPADRVPADRVPADRVPAPAPPEPAAPAPAPAAPVPGTPALGAPTDGRAAPAPGPRPAPASRVSPAPSRDDLDVDSARVLDALPARRAAGPATIAVEAGVDLDTVLRCLGLLAGCGFIERCDGGWRLRRPG